MPDFLTIKRQHDAAKLKGLMSQDSSLADFAKLGALATDDPSYQQVAESPAWKNMIRGWSANVDEAIQSGPIDDWTAEAVGWVGDKFGVTPDASRAAGRELPRQVMNFLPMMAGGAVGGFLGAAGGPAGIAAGAAKGGSIGLGLTSGLSAFDAYGKGGTATDAIIGGVAPYVGGKLSEFGSKAALRSAATPGSFLNRAGFMKGKDLLNPATHTIPGAVAGTTKQVLGETVDTFRDKALGYVAGETLANVGFTGLDIVQQGPDAVLNRDYLFANLASNVPFMAADIPNFTKTRFAWEPVDKALTPTQDQINAEKTRGEVTRESLEAIDNSLAKFQKEAELGVDIGRFIDKNNAVAATMEAHRKSITLEAETFKSTWDKLREVNGALPDVLTGIDPKALLQNPSVIGFDPAKAEVMRYQKALKQINKVKGGSLSRIAKTDANLDSVMGLVEEDLKLPDTLLSTPVAERTVEQYQKALGTKLSDNAVKLIRMKHMEIAQGESFVPEFPKLWEEYNNALTGKFEGSIDDRYELITASLLATGKFPKVVKAQKKAAQEAKVEGQTSEEANVNATNKMATLSKAEQRAAAKAKRDEEKAAADAEAAAVDPLKTAVDARVAAAKAAVEPATPVGEKSKVGRKPGPTQKTVDKNATMEERISLAGKALKPTDEDRFFIIASQMIDPANRAKGLNWMSKVATEHAPLPLAQKLLKFQSGLKTIDERVEASNQLKTVPLNEEITPDAVAEMEAAIEESDSATVPEREEAMRELIVEETARELDEDVPEISQTQQEQNLARDFMVAMAKKVGVEISPADAAVRFANMPFSVREKNLAMAKMWKERGFPQLAAKDIDPLSIHFTTGQPLPIKEFATAWAREAGVPEAEIPATVDDFVRITQMFAAGEARFGTMAGVTKEGAQFARASAGAFDFGMREVKNGQLQRPGKPPLGTKDGWMLELDFRNNGGDVNGVLSKDEVNFYRELVPEAFADGKVHLQKLWDGLGKVGEQVKVVTYGQEAKVSDSKQELDKLTHDWWDVQSSPVRARLNRYGQMFDRPEVTDFVAVKESLVDEFGAVEGEKAFRLLELRSKVANEPKDTSPRATSYYNQISPFDTKKFPVLRVDVVLPIQEKKNLPTGKEAPFSWDRNEGVKWQPDNLHENLPNTLGWAMVQIVPHPVTGEKVMFVGEAQSRWGQAVQKKQAALKSGKVEGEDYEMHPGERAATEAKLKELQHPLLPIHQNLILKAVIKEAQKQGISKVAVSDGETAMMTEGHDKSSNHIVEYPNILTGEFDGTRTRNYGSRESAEQAARNNNGRYKGPTVSQEGGMRLAYDTTMPSIMSKLVGEGKVEDFGLHKSAIQGNARENPMETRTFPTIDEAENFLSQQPGELNHGSIRRVDNGFEVNTPKIGSPVFRNPDGTPKSSVTGIVYNISNPSPRVSTLFAQNQGKVYGAASYDKMQILINSKAFQNKSPAEQLKFIWAHENSHISFRKSLEGQYGPKAKALADALLAWVNSADPQARKNVEDVVRELHLDPELAQLDGIRDVLNNPDPQEWLANVWAMYALGTLKPNNSKAAFSMLPRPIRDFFDWAVSGIQNLAKGAQMWARLSGKDYKAAKDMKELMNTVRRSFRQAEWDAAQAEKFLDIEPSSMIERGNEFAFAQSQENDLDRMGQVGEQKVTDWRTFKRQMGNLWNKAIQPAHTLANSHKEFVEPVLAMYNAPLDTDNAIGDVFKVVVGELDGRDKVQITNKAFERVQKSESLLKLANAIMIRAEVKNQRMIKLKDDGDMVEVVNFDALSPEQRGQFQQFSPEAQQALATYIAQAERANIMTQKKNLESTWSEITSNLALLLTSKSSFNKDDFKKAPAIAEGMLKDLQLGDTEGAVSKLVGLDEFDRAKLMEQTQQLYAEYAKLEKFYNERPTYMSFKRFGDIRQRISKPGEQDDVVDADTELELQEKLKPYLADGWTQTNARIPKKERKNQEYRVNSDLLKLMNDREKLFKNMIQESGTISDEDKNMILNYPSSSDAMISEINSRELYKPTTGRKRTGDLARYDWYEQFVKYTPAAISSAQRRALSAKINFWMQDPALLNKKLQKDQFMALYEQSRNPDPEWVRKVNKLNAVWHIGWNLPGHIAELFQPMVAMLPELQAKGESLPGALKLIQKAERDVVKMHGYRFKDKLFRPDKAEVTVGGETFEGLAAMWIKANGTSKETVDEARMLHEKRGRIQKAPLSEIRDFTGENQIRLEDSMVGRTMSKLKDAVTRPFHTYASAAMGFYSNFTQHNGVVSLITSYRKFRKQGLSHEEAMQKAELFDLTVNNSGGRLERSELYGKLGSIGPLVLGLSSYTRGRFSQLATFYRHGFNSKQFEGKLSNAEIANAKKAFQTMILAQVGAAGLLGLPFVGAGIALMEELLGEDIKGKMLTALDEVTNDPTLSRVFSHGMMSAMAESFGVPADLHSRFALSSFLGTNSYDGISAKSFMGPSVAMLDSMFNLGSELAKGESMEKALTVAGPGGVKRLAEAISEDFQRDNPEANLASSMLGFRSSQMVKRKEWDQITRKQELEGRRDLEKSAMEISKKMEINPRLARQQLLIEADKLVPQGLDRQGIVNQRQQNIKDLIQKVSLLQADKVGPQDPRRQVSGRVAPIASQTAQAMGVQMQNPMELARAMAQQKTRSQLGATSSQRPVRNAMLQEMQWSRNPWEF